MKKNFLFTLAAAAVFFLCSFAAVAQKTIKTEDRTAVSATAKKVVAALKAKNMTRLAAFVHPTKGVRFTPYGYIDAQQDLVFKPKHVKGLMSSPKHYDWGNEDGTGNPIKLTFADYYKRFVYDQDFAAVRKVNFNQRQASGNTVFNGDKIYPNAVFVEYYFPGTKKNEFMDWRALYLTFEKYKGVWHLVSISHNQWTI